MEYKIEHGKEITPPRLTENQIGLRSALRKMKLNTDSIFIPFSSLDGKKRESFRGNIYTNARTGGMKVVIRTLKMGFRVWRIR